MILCCSAFILMRLHILLFCFYSLFSFSYNISCVQKSFCYLWHAQTLIKQVSPSFGKFCIKQSSNSYWLEPTIHYVKNFLWDLTSSGLFFIFWRILSYSICAVFSIYPPDPLSSLHLALCSEKLFFINRLPCSLASSSEVTQGGA